MRRHSFLTILVIGLLSPAAVLARVSVTDLRLLETPLDRIDTPALSPNGDRIAFSAPGPDGGTHLYVISAAGGAPTQITKGTATDLSPVFSPDGARIAFVSNRSGNRDIWIVPAGGGEPTRVTDDPADDIDPAWSPDGLRLAFSSTRGGPPLLYQVTLADRQAYMITAGTGVDRRPAWSPDGTLLAFESTRDGAHHVWLIPPEGGEARRALPNDQGREESWPVWLPGGDLPRPRETDPHARPTLHRDARPGRPGMQQLVIPPVPGVEPGRSAPVPSISRDGRHMVFTGGGMARIEMIAVTGGVPTTILSTQGRLSHPSWSPEGRRLVVSGQMEGSSWDLWQAGISSGRVARLTSDETREEAPVWSKTTGDVLYTVRDGPDRSNPAARTRIAAHNPAQPPRDDGAAGRLGPRLVTRRAIGGFRLVAGRKPRPLGDAGGRRRGAPADHAAGCRDAPDMVPRRYGDRLRQRPGNRQRDLDHPRGSAASRSASHPSGRGDR